MIFFFFYGAFKIFTKASIFSCFDFWVLAFISDPTDHCCFSPSYQELLNMENIDKYAVPAMWNADVCSADILVG